MDLYEEYEHEGRSLCKAYIDGNKIKTPREEEIVNAIVTLSQTSLKHAFVAAVIYITGARLGEITRYKYTGKEKDNIDIQLPAIQMKDIIPVEQNGKQYVAFNLRIEKVFKAKSEMSLEERETKITKKPRRTIYIPYDENHPCFRLLRIIENYIDLLGNKPKDYELIRMGYWNVQKFFKTVFNSNPHMFRHWRAKILTNEYGYTPQDLKLFFGWANHTMPMYYSTSEQQMLMDKLSTYKSNF